VPLVLWLVIQNAVATKTAPRQPNAVLASVALENKPFLADAGEKIPCITLQTQP